MSLVRGEASMRMDEDGYDALEELGCQLARDVNDEDSHAFIGKKNIGYCGKEELVKRKAGYADIELTTPEIALYWFDPGRAYDPMIGRWHSVDPAIMNWNPPRIMKYQLFGFSPYVYVRNSPLNRLDPNGYVDWFQVGVGALGVVGGIAQAVGGGAIAASTGVTVVGAVGGIALMSHGFATTGFGVANIIAGIKDDGTDVPSGPLEAIGGEVGGETGQQIGELGDALVGAGNPLKNLKNAGKLLPTSAKEAKAMVGYQKAVTKEVIQSITTTSSDIQVVKNIKTTIIIEEKDQEDGNDNR